MAPGGAPRIPTYEPMLATAWPEPFVDGDWIFELKWDGIRGLVAAGPSFGFRITSRSGNDLTSHYPELASLDVDTDVILDGEIVALDPHGRPSFEVLQQRSGRTGAEAANVVAVTYVAFDILYDGVETIDEPWSVRRGRLEALGLQPPYDISTVIPGDPTALWSFVEERGIEGIVGKRRSSRYRAGTRSPDWRKITRFRQARAVVGGFTAGSGGRADTFASLLLGLWSGKDLRWIGSVGSGFSDRDLVAIRAALNSMQIDTSPFVDTSQIPSDAVWVEPQLVALVQYKEFTAAGRLRGPSFKGFTDDDLGEVTWEREGPGAPG